MNTTLQKKSSEENQRKKRSQEILENVMAGKAAGASVEQSVKRVAETYRKPDTYDRKLYDDGAAKLQAKMGEFSKGKPVKDPYSGDELLLRKQEAKLKYGKDWQKHLAEADHVEPIHKVYERHKDDAFTTNEDIRKTVNSKENLKAVSRKQNNAKRDKSNEEFYGDEKYLKDKDIHLSKKSREKAIEDGRKAKSHIEQDLQTRQIKNAASEFHQSGIEAAKAGASATAIMSTATNFVAVLRGEKKPSEALKDIAIATGKTAAVSYVTGGVVTVTTQALSRSTSQFAQLLGKAGAPGKVVAAVMATGGTLKRYLSGEISTLECMVELGETSAVCTAASYGAMAGQMLIPIPIVGAMLGSMIGGMLGSVAFNVLSRQFQAEKAARERWIRIEKECKEAIRMIEEYRRELNELADKYMAEHRKVFDEAIGNMDAALQMKDADGFIHAANRITTQLGGEAQFQDRKEFDALMKSDEPLIL